jgi:acetyltransferase
VRYSEQVSEIELNPVLVHPEGHGATIVDALVVAKI